jgi:hypothetical protein
VTIQETTQVKSCFKFLAPVCQLSFNSRRAKSLFSHLHRVFIVEHCLASRSHLNCQNELMGTFLDSPVPHIRRTETDYWAVHLKHHSRNSSPGSTKHVEKSKRGRRYNTQCSILFCFLFERNLFFYAENSVRNWLRDCLIMLYKHSFISRKYTFSARLILNLSWLLDSTSQFTSTVCVFLQYRTR